MVSFSSREAESMEVSLTLLYALYYCSSNCVNELVCLNLKSVFVFLFSFFFFCAEAVLVSLQWLARYYVSIKGKYSMWLLVGRPCIQFGFGCVQKLWLVYCCVCVMSVDGSLFPKQGSDRMHNGFWMDARVFWYLFRTSVWGICILFYFLF